MKRRWGIRILITEDAPIIASVYRMQYHVPVEDSFILAMCDTLPNSPPEIPAEILGPSAWYGPDLNGSPDWIEYLSSTEIAEVEHAVKKLASESRDIVTIRSEDFLLPTLAPRLRSLSRGVQSYDKSKINLEAARTRLEFHWVTFIAMHRSAVEDDDENYSWTSAPFRRPREWEGLSQIDCYEIEADGYLEG